MHFDDNIKDLLPKSDVNTTSGTEEEPVSVGENFGNRKAASGRSAITDKIIRCPYCHKEFSVRKILFRAHNPETEESILQVTEAGSPEYVRLKAFEATEDKRLTRHWKETMAWSNDLEGIREAEDVYFEVRKDLLTDNQSESEDAGEQHKQTIKLPGTSVFNVKCHILSDDQIDWNNTKILEDGYPDEVVDTRGEVSDIRVCPECHCVLPYMYGRYKTVFIACVGIAGSGKTVLLSKFFETMGASLPEYAGVDTLSTSADRFVEQKRIKAGEILPVHTDPETVKPPVVVHMQNQDEETTTFVFYDVAGENCTKLESMSEKCFFLKNVDGIIMMISPKQLLQNEDDVADELNVMNVLECLGDAFFDKARLKGQHKKIDFAVVLSMSDEYKHIGDDIELEGGKYDYMYESIPYNEKKQGYMLDAHDKMNFNIKSTLRSTALLSRLKAKKFNATFFAVSALGSAPQRCKDENTDTERWIAPKPLKTIRLEEPFLWLLYKFGVIPAISKRTFTEKLVLWIKQLLNSLKGDTE